MSARYYIGIDGGGTNTRALMADHKGHVLGVGFSGSANRNHYTREEAQNNLRAALRTAMGSVTVGTTPLTLFLGMSGVSTDSDRQEIKEIVGAIPEVGQESRIIVDNDTVVALTGGLAGKPGVALIAGTGSACLGINERGERWLCGGWGALADDAGSAPWVGLQALQAAVRAEDGRAEPTALQEAIFTSLDLTTSRQLINRIHNIGLDRAALGNLATVVIDTYRKGDATARTILHQAAAELSLLASTTIRKLFGASPCSLILVGGLALSGSPFQEILMDRLHRDIPNLNIQAPILSPVQGAVLEALRAGGVPWTETLVANLHLFDISIPIL